MKLNTKVVTVRSRTKAGKRALALFDRSKFDNNIMQCGIVDEGLQYEDGTGVADVAMWNEYGTDTIPSRPALRFAIKESTPWLIKTSGEHVKKMLDGKMRFDYSARILARYLVAQMKAAVITWDTPSNAPTTIARKGRNDPLIDTGLYKNSIAFKLLKTRKSQV